jgi:prolyl-tRNA synthetase
VPVRLAMGGRDLENGTIEIARRDTQTKETISIEGIVETVKNLLEEIQKNLLTKALDFRIANTREVNSYEEFKEELKKGGFILAHWDGTPETEQRIKDETKATIRCIPLADLPEHHNEPGTCMVTGKPSTGRVVFALNY